MNAAQIRAARGLLKWTQADLSKLSGIGTATIKRLEAQEGDLDGHAGTLRNIERAFLDAGIEFIPADEKGHGVRMAKSGFFLTPG